MNSVEHALSSIETHLKEFHTIDVNMSVILVHSTCDEGFQLSPAPKDGELHFPEISTGLEFAAAMRHECGEKNGWRKGGWERP